MQTRSLDHKSPVLSYTKMSTNPPFSTITEQTFWADVPGMPESLLRFHVRNKPKLSKRPTSSYSTGVSKKERWFRPKSAHTSYTIHDDFHVTGEKYLLPFSKYDELDTEAEVQYSEAQRPSTPDYMEDIYTDYTSKLLEVEHCLLRRPLSSRSPSHESQAELIPPLDIDSLLSDDPLDSIIADLTSTDSSVPSEPQAVPEPPSKQKLTIDISLCDDTGCIIGMPPNSPASVRPSEPDAFSCGEEVLCYTTKTRKSQSESSLRPKTAAKSRRRPPRNTGKRRPATAQRTVVETSAVVVDFSAEGPSSGEKANRNNKPSRRRRKYHDEDIVTQMSTLGLTEPLSDDDLSNIPKHTSPTSRRLEKAEDKSEKPDNGTNNNQAKKQKGRKIPIQVISDPFKTRAGDRAIHRDRVVGNNFDLRPSTVRPKPRPQGRLAAAAVARVNDVYRPNSRRCPSTPLKTPDGQLNRDVQMITNKLLRVGERLSTKKLQRDPCVFLSQFIRSGEE